MTLTNLILLLAALFILLCVLTFGTLAVKPTLRQFLALSSGVDSLQTRMIPLVAFIGLMAIMIKLTVF